MSTSKTYPLYGHPIWGVPAVDGRPVNWIYDDDKVLADQLEKNMIDYYLKQSGAHPILHMTRGQTVNWVKLNPKRK